MYVRNINILLLMLLLFFSVVHAGTKPADGLWGTTDNPEIGSGLMLATQGNITVVSVFTYDAEGNNVWYLASGHVDDADVFEADLLQAQNGSNILVENPQSAEFIETSRTIRLEFGGSQIGTFSIDGSTPKSMQASHFGFYEIATEQLLLADETQYRFPGIEGDWVIGNADSGESYVLSLTNRGTGASPPFPNYALLYSSNHPSTDDWDIYCPQRIQSIQPYCRVIRSGGAAALPQLRIDLQDMGSQRLTIYQDDEEPSEKFQAFRLNNDRRILPNDGYWRSADDPAIGSGLVMRTQGDYTVILLYTYNEEGQAYWQIASGQFDENGLLVADLNLANGGSEVENQSSVTASFSGQVQSLKIQLQGFELATFSIDDSAPKTIQNFNFGHELFVTEVFKPDNQPFVFPAKYGRWVLVNDEKTVTSVWDVFGENPNACLSPPDPLYIDSIGYSNGPSCGQLPEPVFENLNFRVRINCLKQIGSYGNFVYPDISYCYGSNYSDEINYFMKIYFQDIGVKEFRYYVGPRDPQAYYESMELINRESKFYQLFRLSTD